MIVMKFGGTSVQDADAIRNASEVILRERVRTPLVVVSACSGVTNALLDLAKKGTDGNVQEALISIAALHARHCAIAELLFREANAQPGRSRDDNQALTLVKNKIAHDCGELEKLVQSLAVLKELTPRTLDQFAAFGEQWSSLLLSHELLQRGVAASLVDARKVLVTGDEFSRATPSFDRTVAKAREFFLPPLQKGTIVVTQGFIGATENGVTTTIGRGGSDYSAAIFGAALEVEEIQIWTDVDGILSADPSVLPEARRIKQMTFNEAAELAYFGAKVLHPSTILPAIRKNIPVRVLNSKRPEGEGTLITGTAATPAPGIVKSIGYKEHITTITVQSTRMLMAHGFLARLFEVFAKHQKSIDVIATSEVGVSLTIDNADHLESILTELRQFAEVHVEHNKAVFCMVGENMKPTRSIAARVFTALDRAGVNVELISHGGSEINLTFVIDEAQIAAAVKCLHDEFFAYAAQWQQVFD
ncbi:MAG: lysine-sensitive aspartokinase 3 [bacterium]